MVDVHHAQARRRGALVGHLRLERSVPSSQQNTHRIAVGIRHDQVRKSISIQVRDHHLLWTSACGIRHRRFEGAIPISQQNAHGSVEEVRHREIQEAIAVEVPIRLAIRAASYRNQSRRRQRRYESWSRHSQPSRPQNRIRIARIQERNRPRRPHQGRRRRQLKLHSTGDWARIGRPNDRADIILLAWIAAPATYPRTLPTCPRRPMPSRLGSKFWFSTSGIVYTPPPVTFSFSTIVVLGPNPEY